VEVNATIADGPLPPFIIYSYPKFEFSPRFNVYEGSYTIQVNLEDDGEPPMSTNLNFVLTVLPNDEYNEEEGK